MDDNLSSSDINKNTRKKIKQAINILNNLSGEEKEKIIKYTKKFSGLVFINKKFSLSTENDVNKLLYGINERYYETEISKEKRVANSVQKID